MIGTIQRSISNNNDEKNIYTDTNLVDIERNCLDCGVGGESAGSKYGHQRGCLHGAEDIGREPTRGGGAGEGRGGGGGRRVEGPKVIRHVVGGSCVADCRQDAGGDGSTSAGVVGEVVYRGDC